MSKTLKEKGGGDYSIIMDRKSENLILKELKKIKGAYIIAEETGEIGAGDSRYTIYIDPLDGTFNYSNGIPHFCVSIGVYRGKLPYFGVVYDPVHDELFTAKHGRGAFLNGRRIFVRKSDRRPWPIVVGWASKMNEFMKIHNIDSQHLWALALDLSWFACGRYAAAVSPDYRHFDIAAGMIIAQEAGAIIMDFNGRKWTIDDHGSFIASSNRKLYNKLARQLR